MTKKLIIVVVALCAAITACAQAPYDQTGWLPDKESRLVYDYCGLLDGSKTAEMEARLVAFNDSTSNQIVVMITPAFGGSDISSFAFDVGNKWGIGQGEFANGVIIVVKPKDDTDGQVEIAVGTGLEGALPDIFCKRIIEDEMIPLFREGDYAGGISAALDIILPVCAGEYSYAQYKEDNQVPSWFILICLLAFIGVIVWTTKNSGTGGSGGAYFGGYGPTSSWSSAGGGWNSGPSGGGFGGFGGGSFSGGGASGRW